MLWFVRKLWVAVISCIAPYLFQVDALLEGFCRDAGITTDQAVKGISRLSQVPDLREVFHVRSNCLIKGDYSVYHKKCLVP